MQYYLSKQQVYKQRLMFSELFFFSVSSIIFSFLLFLFYFILFIYFFVHSFLQPKKRPKNKDPIQEAENY